MMMGGTHRETETETERGCEKEKEREMREGEAKELCVCGVKWECEGVVCVWCVKEAGRRQGGMGGERQAEREGERDGGQERERQREGMGWCGMMMMMMMRGWWVKGNGRRRGAKRGERREREGGTGCGVCVVWDEKENGVCGVCGVEGKGRDVWCVVCEGGWRQEAGGRGWMSGVG
jgi:hypothetical protein